MSAPSRAEAAERARLMPASFPKESPLCFHDVYDAWFHQVSQWARALGGPSSDLDDLAQDVFLIVNRQLHRFDGKNLPGWLYRITARTVRDHRRRAWFRRIFLRPRDIAIESFEEPSGTPAALLETKEDVRVAYQLLDKMSAKRRSAFVLFEIEGYSGEEIAALEGIPVATVWTRLHHARKEFLSLVSELRSKGEA